jgi:Flp pilus assembly protein TadD
MSLRQCIESWRALCLGLLLALAGCADGPETLPADAANSEAAGDAVAVPPEALTLYERAVASMAAGESMEAELRLQEFLLQYPQFPGAHTNLAIIFAERGDFDAARTSLDEALALDPANAAALNRLGIVLRSTGRFREAEEAYLRAIAAEPDYALAYYNLGVLNDLYFQHFAEALQYYERYQELAGEDVQVGKWIADLERRVAAAQRAANVTE